MSWRSSQRGRLLLYETFDMSQTGRVCSKWWLAIPGVLVLLCLLVVGFFLFQARAIEERIRRSVVQALGERFRSEVDLDAIHIKVFPRLGITGEGLTLRHHGRKDVPPLIHIEKFSFTAAILGHLRPVKHIPRLRVENMIINIPPRGPKEDQPPPNPSRDNKSTSTVVVDQVICNDVDIVILPKKADKDPLDWDIHNLILSSAGSDKPLAFHGNLTNGKPKGEIDTEGQFGPWDADDPGGSPVSGEYKFTDADLGPFPGIAGKLSSDGKYSGVLSELRVEGQTDTPDFSLDKVGRPVPLHTDFSATVDGTSGDTYFHPVNATLVRSLIVAEGSVVRVSEKKGHLITIDATVPNGRIQDFLSLAINSDKPLMTGPVKIKAKLIIPPGKEKALEKIIVDGQFGVYDSKWSSPALREKLKSLSRHGQGKPEDKDTGSSVSDLEGSFHLENGVINFLRLTFSVEGAGVDLTGTYILRGGDLDLTGHLRLQAKLSQTMTGATSFFLKGFDPLFKKGSAGTVIPIRITGTRDKPTFGITVFHKTIKKEVSSDKNKQQNKSSPK
jgi:hypothetical protein